MMTVADVLAALEEHSPDTVVLIDVDTENVGYLAVETVEAVDLVHAPLLDDDERFEDVVKSHVEQRVVVLS